MGRAEVGTPKYVANQMKARGLQRLRWYCQVCEKQCRDENGFKCHTLSESHVRKMLAVSDDAKRSIERYSQQFLSDFIYLLRTGHGEKAINANRFYQDYIHKKDHVHMNATKWTSLSQLVKYLGREGICKVTEDEKDGLCIAWIDSTRIAEHDKSKNAKSEGEISMKLLQRQIDAAAREQQEREHSTQQEANGSQDDSNIETNELKPDLKDREEDAKQVKSEEQPQIRMSIATRSYTAKPKPNKPRPVVAMFNSGDSSRRKDKKDTDTDSYRVKKDDIKGKQRPQNAFERIMMRESRN